MILYKNTKNQSLRKFDKKISVVILALFFNIHNIYSQNNSEVLTYNWFDKSIGIESLDIKNGLLHLNFDKTANNNNRYYISNDFKIGTVNYNNQDYYDLFLKYDIYTDELILKPYDKSSTTQINLIKENITFFKIGEQKFVNLNQAKPFKTGYYEETSIGKNIFLYTKYYKEKNKVIKDNFSSIEYSQKNEFLLLKENKFYWVNEKNQIIKLYPDSKKNINNFYFSNKALKKNDNVLFMKNLMKYINN